PRTQASTRQASEVAPYIQDTPWSTEVARPSTSVSMLMVPSGISATTATGSVTGAGSREHLHRTGRAGVSVLLGVVRSMAC
ncbi:MAG: hypothetical protein V3V01_10485, partial [Acidimicrobiales bacterium]